MEQEESMVYFIFLIVVRIVFIHLDFYLFGGVRRYLFLDVVTLGLICHSCTYVKF